MIAPPQSSDKLTALMNSPLPSLLPWIVMAILAGPKHHELAVVVGLSIALFIAYFEVRMAHRKLKALQIFDIAYFSTLVILGLVAPAPIEDWIVRWSGEVSSLALVAFSLGSILVRVPFTLQYAKEDTDPEDWDQPLFKQINFTITWVWTGYFVVNALCSYLDDAYFGPNSFWLGYIVPIGVSVLAIAFTEWYPDARVAREQIAGGLDVPAPASPFVMIEPVPTFAIIVGVCMLVFEQPPAWLGIALIVGGTVAAAAFAKLGPKST